MIPFLFMRIESIIIETCSTIIILNYVCENHIISFSHLRLEHYNLRYQEQSKTVYTNQPNSTFHRFEWATPIVIVFIKVMNCIITNFFKLCHNWMLDLIISEWLCNVKYLQKAFPKTFNNSCSPRDWTNFCDLTSCKLFELSTLLNKPQT